MANTESAHLRSLGLPVGSDEMRVNNGTLPEDEPTAPAVVAALLVAQAPAKAAEISDTKGSKRAAGESRGIRDVGEGEFDNQLNEN